MISSIYEGDVMKYDGELTIAVGRSRKEKKWKNKDILWSELVERLSETTRTAETHNEYMSSPKSRQAEIKDVGGFVGGYLSQGTRKADSVVNRTVITLDIDHAKPDTDLLETLDMLYGNAAVIYSTHRHTPESPKLRLVIPINRPVFADEYEAISRRIAGDLGINDFDDTTFQPSRLMYWPSTSKDGEYLFQKIDGPWLDADQVLDTYFDWKDSSSWPLSDRVDKVIARSIKKQGDPLEKPGLIGAFCRCYNIHEAIEKYLKDEYEECNIEGRYTYKHGSTAAGLVTYDDKFAYSHHGTDPASGKLCNAFDLVRIHKFGLKDEDAKENTPNNRLPSYRAMVEFAARDKTVRQQLGKEKIEAAMEDFSEEIEIDTSWTENLDIDSKGRIKSSIDNIMIILRNDYMLKGKLAYNIFNNKCIALKDLPWRKIDRTNNELRDVDDSGLRHYLEATYGITGINKINDATALIVKENSFHPVLDYLDTLEWDGQERVDRLLIDYLGAEDCKYVKAVTKKALVACIARIKNPGCKFDYVLTLVGKQGIGKSTLFKKLGGKWFSDSFTTVQGKEAVEQIQGYWLIEMAELSGLRKAEVETIKHFMSKQEDVYRPAYGRRTETHPRQCVFFGTTNNSDFLNDSTGNRRFWAVDTMIQEPTKDLFTDMDQEEIDQIWAEALHLYQQGESLYLDKEMEAEANKIQEQHTKTDERVGLVEEYLNLLLPEDWYDRSIYDRVRYIQDKDTISEKGTILRDRISVIEIWTELFCGQKKDLDRKKSMEIHNILRGIEGWEKHSNSSGILPIKGYGNQRAYVRIEN